MSFKELDNYFSDPDLTIKNLDTITIKQFEKDLDSIVDFSKKKIGLYGKIENYSISADSNSSEKAEAHYLINSPKRSEKFRSCKILNKLFKHESLPITKIKIESWNFADFDDTEKFRVGNLYTIKPVSITYNSAKQDYRYDKQILSEFCIEEANGTIKKLLIVDTIKKGKIKREKYIDDHKINGQHNNFEVRSHRLNRSLMKTFLFHQINKCKTPQYDQDNNLIQKKTGSGFAAAQPQRDVICQAEEPVFLKHKPAVKVPEEYIKIIVSKAHSRNQTKASDINTFYRLQNKFKNNTAVDNHLQVQEICGMKSDSIYVADDYNDLTRRSAMASRFSDLYKYPPNG